MYELYELYELEIYEAYEFKVSIAVTEVTENALSKYFPRKILVKSSYPRYNVLDPFYMPDIKNQPDISIKSFNSDIILSFYIMVGCSARS